MRASWLDKSADPQKRFEVLQLLFNKAEAKVTHADTFRQRNMNYALVLFAGLIALRFKFDAAAAKLVISNTLFVISVIFCVWDRRWHRMKHGWDSTGRRCLKCMIEMTNNANQGCTFYRYDRSAEGTAEWFSWQPVVFYLLVLGSFSTLVLELFEEARL